MTRRNVKFIGWLCIGAVYVLTLVTQLPHIYDVYASLESSAHTLFGVNTALGAAIAFEASVAIFTLRVIVNTKSERSRWTRGGIVAFLFVSAVANVAYYFDLAPLDEVVMPAILALALPFALWLYAEEFGRGARAQARQRERMAAPQETKKRRYYAEPCAFCEWSGDDDGYDTLIAAQNARNAHSSKHKGKSKNDFNNQGSDKFRT